MWRTVPRTFSWCSSGSLRSPAVPNRKMGVLPHRCLGTTSSAQSSSGDIAFSTKPGCNILQSLLTRCAPTLQVCRADARHIAQ